MPDPLTTASASPGISAWISAVSVAVPPVSAMLSIPGVAVPSRAQKVTPAVCTAPMSGEKCAPPGKLVGCVDALQVASKATRYVAVADAVGGGGSGSGSGLGAGPVPESPQASVAATTVASAGRRIGTFRGLRTMGVMRAQTAAVRKKFRAVLSASRARIPRFTASSSAGMPRGEDLGFQLGG